MTGISDSLPLGDNPIAGNKYYYYYYYSLNKGELRGHKFRKDKDITGAVTQQLQQQ